MCPSWKGTRNRVHSPKGRASLIREWLRLQGQHDVDVLAASDHLRFTSNVTSIAKRAINTVAKKIGQQDFSHEVYEAMSGCLACKSCAGQCPVKVNVPEFRSRFLELYHSRYLRPLKDYLIGSLEYTIPYIARVPRLYNFVMGARPVRFVLKHVAGMVDSPLLSMTDFDAVCRRWGVEIATPEFLSTLADQQRARSVILVQDAFTRYFETPVLSDWIELISRLGYKVYVAPFAPNGKPLQVQGFIKAFEKAARFNGEALHQLQEYEIPLVGLDPAMTLVYRQEYAKTLGSHKAPTVLLAQEWLANTLPQSQIVKDADPYHFLPHCTEKTNEPSSIGLWLQVYERMGLKLSVQASGCCGMSGTYGHEATNAETSDIIYGQSWRPLVEKFNRSGRMLADGYSCRSQVKRKEGVTILHPLQALLAVVRAETQ
jgi:Fe-S oxidoreductase